MLGRKGLGAQEYTLQLNEVIMHDSLFNAFDSESDKDTFLSVK